MVNQAERTGMPKLAPATGQPDLIQAIAAEIRREGPIPFTRFMDLALYHPQFGYYMRGGENVATPEAAPEGMGVRIGWAGDYYTSSDVHPILGQALARQARQVDERLGHPSPFTVLEMGAGKGLLARDVLASCATSEDSLGGRLRYILLERSPAMRTAQRANLAPWLGPSAQGSAACVSWVESLDDLAPGSVAGLMLSNELVDAFPVHRIKIVQGEPKEIYVDYQDGRFCDRLAELSTPELSRYLQRLAQQDIRLPEGYTTEINLAALDWMRQVARVLGRGVVLTIDYGHTAQDLYGPARQKGTLLCYYHQMASEDPYQRVGEQDMTAHVDFSTLATVGEEAGLQVTGFTNQMSFLIGLGAEQLLDAYEPGSREFQGVIHLLRPEGMGRTFKILAQHKGLSAPELDGLRYKPFFGTALTAHGTAG